MIRLLVAPYCHKCPKFDPEVKMILYGNDILHDTQVTCTEEAKCRRIAEHIRAELSEKKEKENDVI